MELSQEEIDNITAAIAAGRKIEAIKQYRAATGQGLKEAKDFIEALTDRLHAEDPEKFALAKQPSGCGPASAILIAVVILGVLLPSLL